MQLASKHSVIGTFIPLITGALLAGVGAVVGFAEVFAAENPATPVGILASVMVAAGGWLLDQLRNGKVDQAKLEYSMGSAVDNDAMIEVDESPVERTDALA